MIFERLGCAPFDYRPVRYGASKLTFRGPERDLSGAYIACLGGTETYGKFLDRPWPARLEAALGLPCVNFGLPNAGPDVILHDKGLLDLARGASAVILQVPGAMNLSNPYYDVHPRRNDRFLRARTRLRRLYPEVDFTEFNFTRHMMWRLASLAPERFALLRNSLQDVWVDRMHRVIARIDRPVILLWLANHAPGTDPNSAEVCDDPALVSRAMIRAIRPRATHLTQVVISKTARDQGTRGMRFSPMEESAATDLPGPLAHAEAAQALLPALRTLTEA
ncbi:hypothetical protein RA2_03901 [Roseovarius sp. A-2]|uniref:DUF6473 family protein n=1 Tax=Roseovarius sp. A-2 TaxID=1570360 RepID=UPI0009B522F1|nr:DUF6473 family protein [Roseovarius sp. A-2]GAW36826.1 hypothetical protein RA2_03901 [Roseovarius sp. A-2]